MNHNNFNKTKRIKIFKYLLIVIPVLILLMGCSKKDVLNVFINEAADSITAQIDTGGKIVLFNLTSPTVEFSSYTLDELSAKLAESGKFTITGSRETDRIRSETKQELYGAADDDTLFQAGRLLGAKFILTGKAIKIESQIIDWISDAGMPIPDKYRIELSVLNVQSREAEARYADEFRIDEPTEILLNADKTIIDVLRLALLFGIVPAAITSIGFKVINKIAEGVSRKTRNRVLMIFIFVFFSCVLGVIQYLYTGGRLFWTFTPVISVIYGIVLTFLGIKIKDT